MSGQLQLHWLYCSCVSFFVLLTARPGVSDTSNTTTTVQPDSPSQYNESVCTSNTGDWSSLKELLKAGKNVHCHRVLWNDTDTASGGGGLLVGGLLPMNALNDDTFHCETPSNINRVRLAMQLAEAFLYAIEVIRDELRVVNPVLTQALQGVEIRDSCLSPYTAVSEAFQMAKRSQRAKQLCDASETGGFPAIYKFALNSSKPSEELDFSNSCPISAAPTIDSGRASQDLEIGLVLGPALSKSIEVVAPALSVFKMPHIAYWASSPKFEEKQQFPYLFRTVPSDRFQAKAMADLLAAFRWTYVYALASDDVITGGRGLQYFREAVNSLGENYCIAYETRFHYKDKDTVRAIVRRIVVGRNDGRTNVYKDPSVVMLFAGFLYAGAVFDALEELVLANDTAVIDALEHRPMVWIASDAWIAQAPDIVYGRTTYIGQHTVLGFSFKVPTQFHSYQESFADGFQQHLESLRLTRESIRRNPWLGLLWQSKGKCKVEFDEGECSEEPCCNLTLSAADFFNLKGNNMAPPLTSGALWLASRAAVGAISKMSSRSRCWRHESSSALYHYLRDLDIPCRDGQKTFCPVFNVSQDIEAMYTIQSIRVAEDKKATRYIVGSWSQRDGIQFSCSPDNATNISCIEWIGGAATPPESYCSKPCRAGQNFQPVKDLVRPASAACCWQCSNCYGNTFTNTTTSLVCLNCTYGYKNNIDHSDCEAVVVLHYDFNHPVGIVITVLSCVGILAVVFTGLFLYWFRHEPLVRETGSALNYALLVSFLVAFVTSICLQTEPSKAYCVTMSILTATTIIAMNTVLTARSLRVRYMSKAFRASQRQRQDEEHRRRNSELPGARLGSASDDALTDDGDAAPVEEKVTWTQRLQSFQDPFANLFSPSWKRQLLFCFILIMILGVGMHGAFQAIDPHTREVFNYTETEFHLVCTESERFNAVSTACLFISILIMFLSVCLSRKLITKQEMERLSKLAADKNQVKGKMNTEGKLLMLAGFSVLALFVGLTPTFFVTKRVLWPIMAAVSLNAEALAIWACVFVPRLYLFRREIIDLVRNFSCLRNEGEVPAARGGPRPAAGRNMNDGNQVPCLVESSV